MPYNLFLDDDPKRIPNKLTWIKLPDVDWTIVRTFQQFVDKITKDGLPEMVSFDHDLADEHYQEYFRANNTDGKIKYENVREMTGYHCAQWLAHYCVAKNLPVPVYFTHTLNPMGAENIKSAMESAKKFIRVKNDV